MLPQLLEQKDTALSQPRGTETALEGLRALHNPSRESELFFIVFLATFFLRLFRIHTSTLFSLFSRSLSSLFIAVARESDTPFLLVSLFAVRPPTYLNILGGRQRHPLWRLRGVDLQEDDWRQS